VSRRARVYLDGSLLDIRFSAAIFKLMSITEKLQHSRYIEDVDHITQCFDKSTKLTFRNPEEPSYIRFGGARDRDPSVDIRSGQMKLPGCVGSCLEKFTALNIVFSADVAQLFQPSIDAIIDAIAKQRSVAWMPVTVSL
jgi:hypothetical protein